MEVFARWAEVAWLSIVNPPANSTDIENFAAPALPVAAFYLAAPALSIASTADVVAAFAVQSGLHSISSLICSRVATSAREFPDSFLVHPRAAQNAVDFRAESRLIGARPAPNTIFLQEHAKSSLIRSAGAIQTPLL
jgi:hypothetical protein